MASRLEQDENIDGPPIALSTRKLSSSRRSSSFLCLFSHLPTWPTSQSWCIKNKYNSFKCSGKNCRGQRWGAPERLNISIITDVLMTIMSVSWEARIRETHQVSLRLLKPEVKTPGRRGQLKDLAVSTYSDSFIWQQFFEHPPYARPGWGLGWGKEGA